VRCGRRKEETGAERGKGSARTHLHLHLHQPKKATGSIKHAGLTLSFPTYVAVARTTSNAYGLNAAGRFTLGIDMYSSLILQMQKGGGYVCSALLACCWLPYL